MHILDAIILGIIQGVTEFLPISSSGHLIIARDILGWHGTNDLSFDAVLQLATALAIIFFFWKDIWKLIKTFFMMILRKPVEKKDSVMIFAIIIGTIPAIIGGLFLESKMESVFRNASLVAVILIIGSLVMYYAEKLAKKDSDLSIKKGFYIGLFQCLALVPGFSRSGATISGGLFCGLNREEAARFSFLLSIPIILGSGIKKLADIILTSGATGISYMELIVGSLTAFAVGLFIIGFLIKYLKNHSLNVFIWYRLFLAAIILIFL